MAVPACSATEKSSSALERFVTIPCSMGPCTAAGCAPRPTPRPNRSPPLAAGQCGVDGAHARLPRAPAGHHPAAAGARRSAGFARLVSSRATLWAAGSAGFENKRQWKHAGIRWQNAAACACYAPRSACRLPPHPKPSNGTSALMLAADFGTEQQLRMLLACGASTDVADRWGRHGSEALAPHPSCFCLLPLPTLQMCTVHAPCPPRRSGATAASVASAGSAQLLGHRGAWRQGLTTAEQEEFEQIAAARHQVSMRKRRDGVRSLVAILPAERPNPNTSCCRCCPPAGCLLLQATADPSSTPPTSSAGSRPQSGAISERYCVLCWVRPRDVLFLPCRHMSCCATCAAKLPQRLCPTCRAPITSQIEVMLP